MFLKNLPTSTLELWNELTKTVSLTWIRSSVKAKPGLWQQGKTCRLRVAYDIHSFLKKGIDRQDWYSLMAPVLQMCIVNGNHLQ